MTDPAPHREAIMMALERLLGWPEIARSPQLGRFLSYIVQRTLDGDEQSIKAYSIAVDVFGRGADFDPQSDPIVRVQARRLRALLDDYYSSAGLGEVLRIQLPTGRYVPEFVAAPDPGLQDAPPEPGGNLASAIRWNFAASWFTLAVIALVLSMTAYAMTAWRPALSPGEAPGAVQRPSITVVEFQNLAGDADVPPRVAGLAIELVTDLEQFGNIVPRYGGGGETNIAMPDLPVSDFVLTGIVRQDADAVQYSAILTDSRTDAVVWNHTVSVSVEEAALPSVLDKVSNSLSLVLGSPRGPLHVAARQYLASVASSADTPNSYLCRVLFDTYRETGGAREAQRADFCYRALSEADQDTAPVLAATASLLVEQSGGAGAAPQADREELAITRLQRALTLDPLSGFVWEQQGRLHQGQGLVALARADFSSSVQLNPAAVDALAAYALLLAFGGDQAAAAPLARDAAERSPNPPPWYFGVPALLELREYNYAQAIAYADRYAQADRELGPILAIMGALRSRDSAVVNRYLPQVLDVATFRAKGVMPRLSERIADPQFLEAIRLALIVAGVPAAALIEPF